MPPEGRFAREHFTFATETVERVPGLAVKLAKTAGRRPAVMVLHGTGDSKEGMVPLLEAVADRGFLAVAIDGRHHGERAVGSNDYVRAILEPTAQAMDIRFCTTRYGTPCASSTISSRGPTLMARASG